jgi:alanine dehydrogenase
MIAVMSFIAGSLPLHLVARHLPAACGGRTGCLYLQAGRPGSVLHEANVRTVAGQGHAANTQSRAVMAA